MLIKELSAKKILDSRNAETIEVSCNCSVASSPSGKSTGKYETPCYHNSLDWNVNFINKLELNFEISSFEDLVKVEKFIKKQAKLKDVKQFGANALFALESAILKALADSKRIELWQLLNEKAHSFPRPLGNAIGGGLHSHAENHPTFQEFLLAPKGNSFKEYHQNMNFVYEKIGKELQSSKVNDEGAWECSLNEEQVLDLLSKYKDKTDFGVDVASSSFYKSGDYVYNNKTLDKNSQAHFINALIDKYDLLYVEDPLDEEDFSGFKKIEKKHLIAGDDLTVTHLQRLKKAVRMKAINAIIVKPNQNGSLVEVKELIEFCKKNKIKTILSHRSGETLDNALADYAFGFQTDFIKCGIATKWREAKLQRLLEIEKSLK
jgi:enolase